MIPLRILLDVETNPTVTEEERLAMPSIGQLGNVAAIGVLTEGTTEGRPVVIVRIEQSDGSFVLGQTTLRLLQTAMLAFRARYGDLTT
jgi:hypothetical protein